MVPQPETRSLLHNPRLRINAIGRGPDWSVVLTAGLRDTTRAQAALKKLCRADWFPLRAYARRRGHSVEDAQDPTREFFARVLEHHWLARADQAKGRFRTFLLTAMERFLTNEWDKVRALKRGATGKPREAGYGGGAFLERRR